MGLYLTHIIRVRSYQNLPLYLPPNPPPTITPAAFHLPPKRMLVYLSACADRARTKMLSVLMFMCVREGVSAHAWMKSENRTRKAKCVRHLFWVKVCWGIFIDIFWQAWISGIFPSSPPWKKKGKTFWYKEILLKAQSSEWLHDGWISFISINHRKTALSSVFHVSIWDNSLNPSFKLQT